MKGKGNIQRRGGENIGEFVDERLSSWGHIGRFGVSDGMSNFPGDEFLGITEVCELWQNTPWLSLKRSTMGIIALIIINYCSRPISSEVYSSDAVDVVEEKIRVDGHLIESGKSSLWLLLTCRRQCQKFWGKETSQEPSFRNSQFESIYRRKMKIQQLLSCSKLTAILNI